MTKGILLIAVTSFLITALYYGVLTGGNAVNRYSIDNSFSIDFKADSRRLPSDDFLKVPARIFSFAKHFQSHMVLQQAPQRANIYGFSSDIGANVALELITPTKVYHYTTVVVESASSDIGSWNVTLDPVKTNESVSIRATSYGESLLLEDVLFGDVWLCSGQSNMVFMVQKIFGANEVIMDAARYPNIRFMGVYREGSVTPLDDLKAVDVDWNSPLKNSVARFSAVCWLFGKAIHEALGYPIGLVETDYSGTPVAAWSSPAALAKCGVENVQFSSSSDPPLPTDNSVLWNAMVHPLLGMTISGVIWYQGEEDGRSTAMTGRYNCTFPAMIDDWRLHFNKASSGETNSMFPFGFVQLAPSIPPDDPRFTDIRWHQTADYGYVPNERLHNVFMAVALDLPDFDSPSGPIHVRYKQEIAHRLSLSGLAVAYDKKQVFQGPFPVSAELESNTTLVIDYGSQWHLSVRTTQGFELLCTSGKQSKITWWLPTGIIKYTSTKVTLLASVCGEGQQVLGLRYLWQTTPCALKTCAVYSTINELPAPPFVSFVRNFNDKQLFKFRYQTLY